MIERVLSASQTIGSTFEQPIERAHDLGKQKVSRRSICGAGHGNPHLSRESGLRRTAIETAIQKKRRRCTRDEVDSALVDAKRIKVEEDFATDDPGTIVPK